MAKSGYPLRFMKLKGLTRSTAPHLANSASSRACGTDFSQVDPNCATTWSTTINPMLCRVAAYSGPGFPRPAMRRIGGIDPSRRVVFSESVILSGGKAQSKNPADLPDSNVPGSLDSARDDNGLFLLFLLRSLFFRSLSGRSSTFALFLFLGGHFRSCGRSLSFRCNWFFLYDRRQHGEGRQIELHLGRYTLWKLNIANVNGIADIQL